MTKSKRGRYTLEFKQEAVRLVESGQSQAAVARSLEVVEQTLGKRSSGKQAGLIFHSDRGSQYAREDFRKVLEHCSITPSMSRKGNCWDNACSETLFGSLKVERLHGQRFETIRQAKDETIARLLWYNKTRMHSTLNYLSPVEFEQRWQEATEKIAA